MTLKSTNRQNKQISHGVYGLLAIVITIFVSILILLQLQHNEEIKREALDNDYHLAISKYGLEIMRTIDTAKLWFRDQEIIRLKNKISLNGEKDISPIQIKLQEIDQINELKVEIKKPIKEILRLQEKYKDTEFRTVTLLLEQSYIRILIDLDELLTTRTYSSQVIDKIIDPLASSVIQLQRLHQHTYQKMYLSYEDFHIEKRKQIVSLVIALTIIGLIGVFIMLRHLQDTLTELENTQSDLQKERDFSSNLITTAPVIILLLDHKGLIQHVNPYFEQLTGYALKEIKDKEWIANFLPSREQNSIQTLLNKTLHGTPVRGNTNAIIIRDGTEREIEWYTETMYDASGIVTGVLSVGMDITERKQAEEEIEKYRYHLEELVRERTAEMKTARDEAERSSAAKSQFLSHMSHELRTPMNAILGFAQILRLDADEFTETQQGNVTEILDAGHHLLQLINELLDLTKIESGRLEISLEEVQLDDVLQQSITLINPQANARHLKVIDNISNKGYCVKADFTPLKQVMVNLLSNAVKYNCDNGQITLDAKIINKERLRIYVKDTGKGLRKEEIAQLFTSFVRLDTLDNVEGTGIGLVITKHLVELMDGTINIDSTPGEGSEFWVELELIKGKKE